MFLYMILGVKEYYMFMFNLLLVNCASVKTDAAFV